MLAACQAGAVDVTDDQQEPQDCEATTSAWQLPWEMLVLVLQHIDDLPDRLIASTVSTTWHSAALAATHAIQHRSSSKASTAALQAWLAAHGRHVKTVQLSAAYYGDAELQLDMWGCPRLEAVSLSHFMLTHLDGGSPSTVFSSDNNAAPADTAAGAAAGQGPRGVAGFGAFSHLTSLSLQYCCISSLTSLAAAQRLRHLRLEKPQPSGFSPAAAAYCLDAAALAPLTRLTSLVVIKGSYRELFSTVCGFTRLRELQLVLCRDAAAAAAGFDSGALWQQLVGLTALQVEGVPGLPLVLSSRSASSSSSSSSNANSSLPFQQLLRLEVTAAAGFDPLLLSAARGLQHLQLTSTPLMGGPSGTAALLDVLGHITNLQHLNLKGTLQHVAPAAAAAYLQGVAAGSLGIHAAAVQAAAAGVQPQAGLPWQVAAAQGLTGGNDGAGSGLSAGARDLGVAAYAALTASSSLQHLDLSRCLLPPGAVAAMFPSSSDGSSKSEGSSIASGSSRGIRLPLLQQLLLSDTFAVLTAADMQGLVASCPALRRLDIIRATPYDAPMPAAMLALLPSLRHLTQLSLSNVDDAGAAQLARLTSLDSLSSVWQSSISDAGVRQLTALRRLRQLWVHGDLSRQLAPGYVLSLQSKELPPDVWCQLQEL